MRQALVLVFQHHTFWKKYSKHSLDLFRRSIKLWALDIFLDFTRKNQNCTENRSINETRPPLRNGDAVVIKWTSGWTSLNTDLNGKQNQQCFNLVPSGTTSTKTKPKSKKKAKNGPEKSTRKFYTVSIKYKKTHQKHAQPKEPANSSVKEKK